MVEQGETPKTEVYPTMGKYNLIRTLGAGGFSKVKLGEDQETGQKVAIKIHRIQKDDPHYKQTEQYIANEISFFKSIKHPNIVSLIEYIQEAQINYPDGRTKTVIFVVIEELCHGSELFYYIAQGRYFSEHMARYLFHQIIGALDYLHSQGYSHRDIKPDNILLDDNFNIKIADFGFVGSTEFSTEWIGTNLYKSPEIHMCIPYSPEKADIFAAGVVLFMMRSANAPYQKSAERNDAIYRLIIKKEFDTYWKRYIQWKGNNELFYSDEFKDLIQSMLAFDPKERISMDQIKEHEWFKGMMPSEDEIKTEFQRRFQTVVKIQPLHQQPSSLGELQGEKKTRGKHDEELGDPFVPEKKIDVEPAQKLITRIEMKENPQDVFDIIEKYSIKLQEENEMELNLSDEYYKATLKRDEVSIKIKAYYHESKDYFVYEFSKLQGGLYEFLELFEEIKSHIYDHYGYSQKQDAE